MNKRLACGCLTIATGAMLCVGSGSAAPQKVKKPSTRSRRATPAPTRASPSLSPDDPPSLSTFPISDEGEVSFWRGDGNALDDLANNPGTATGGVSYSPAMNGRGFRFAGRDDAIRVEDSYSLRITGSMTINAWINVDEFPGAGEDKGMVLFRGDDRPGLDPYALWIGTDHRVTFHVESDVHAVDLSAAIPPRRFVMVTAILDVSTRQMSLYENTVLVARLSTPIRPLGDLDKTQHPGVGIGNCNDVPESSYRLPFHGVINNLRLYSRVLAPGEIHALYADCLSVPSSLPRGEN